MTKIRCDLVGLQPFQMTVGLIRSMREHPLTSAYEEPEKGKH
jgi:hypothetical protein